MNTDRATPQVPGEIKQVIHQRMIHVSLLGHNEFQEHPGTSLPAPSIYSVGMYRLSSKCSLSVAVLIFTVQLNRLLHFIKN